MIRARSAVEAGVQGPVSWANDDLDDLALLRSDGAPTYNRAGGVDDHDMGVTHVIRGDDHLNNAARQSLIYDAPVSYTHLRANETVLDLVCRLQLAKKKQKTKNKKFLMEHFKSI